MAQTLTKAQIRFQKIKRQERRDHKEAIRQAKSEAFAKRRGEIEERIAEGLILRGLEVNEKAVRHLAFDQARREMRNQ